MSQSLRTPSLAQHFLQLTPLDLVDSVSFTLKHPEDIVQLQLLFPTAPTETNHTIPLLFFTIQLLQSANDNPTFTSYLAVFQRTKKQTHLLSILLKIPNCEVQQMKHLTIYQLHHELSSISFKEIDLFRRLKTKDLNHKKVIIYNPFAKTLVEESLLSLGHTQSETLFVISNQIGYYLQQRQYRKKRQERQQQMKQLKHALNILENSKQQIHLSQTDLNRLTLRLKQKQLQDNKMEDCQPDNDIQQQNLEDYLKELTTSLSCLTVQPKINQIEHHQMNRMEPFRSNFN